MHKGLLALVRPSGSSSAFRRFAAFLGAHPFGTSLPALLPALAPESYSGGVFPVVGRRVLAGRVVHDSAGELVEISHGNSVAPVKEAPDSN